MLSKVKFYIDKLHLTPHPEGGYFSEIYRSEENILLDNIKRYKSNRNFSTSIYYLLEGKDVSLFHRLNSDEIWHFYDGSAVRIYQINDDGVLSEEVLGNDVEHGEKFQVIIKRRNWFAAELISKDFFALVGCTVAPGFEFEDFELADRNFLLKLSPSNSEIIRKLTKFTG